MKQIQTILILSFVFFLNSRGQTVGDFRSKTGGTGVWNDYNAWERYNGTSWVAAENGQIPVATTPVEIKVGDNMIINAGSLVSGNLFVNGLLTFHTTILSTLSVCGNVTVGSTGRFTSPSSGTITTHLLYIGGINGHSPIGGDLFVQGVFDMNVIPTAGVQVSFVGTPNNSISGSGKINFYTLKVDKGSGNCNSVLEVLNPTIITIPDAKSSLNRLLISLGTFKLSSALTLKPYYGSFTLCESTGRLWLNNSNAVVQSVGAGVDSQAGGQLNLFGKLQIDAGTFSYGVGDSFFNCKGGGIVLGGEKADLNIYGYLSITDSSKYIMSNGNVNIYPQIGTKRISGNTPIFQFIGKSIDFTGGVLTITDPNPSTGTDLALDIQSGACNFSGSTIRFGNGSSDLDGTSNGFMINTGNNFLGDVVVNNLATSNKLTRMVKLSKNSGIGGNLIINPGIANQLILNGYAISLKGNLLNFGSLISDAGAGSGLIMTGTTQQEIRGNNASSMNIHNLTISNTSTANPSVDIEMPVTVSNNLTLTDGTIGSLNNSVFTLGNSAFSTSLNITRSGGSFALIPSYALGNVTSIYLTYNSPVNKAAITTGNELPPGIQISKMTVNNTGGVVLDKSVRCMNLTLQEGNLVTTNTTPLTVTGTASTSITKGSSTSYVNGPLTRVIPNDATGSNYKFPIGKSTYQPFEFSSITTGGIGTTLFTAEVFDKGPFPGTTAVGLSSIKIDKYWKLTADIGSVTIASSNVMLTESGLTPTNRIGQSNSYTGDYNSVGGIINGGVTISSVNPIDYSTISTSTYFRIGTASGIKPGVYAVGPNAPYEGYLGSFPTLAAAVASVSSVPLSGDLIFELQPDYKPSVEIFPIVLTSNIVTDSTATITFRPATSVSTVIDFTGSSSIVTNTGADHIIFDGRRGGTGTSSFFQFTSSSVVQPVISLSGDVHHNQILYSGIKGSTTQSSNGLLTIGLPTNRNNFITIDHCTFDGSGTANNCIYASGIVVDFATTNSNFYDFRNGGGINLTGGCTNTIIDSNNFYQRTPYKGFAGTTYGILVLSGNNVRISNNNIGGNDTGLAGTWTVSTDSPAAYNFTGIDATSLAKGSKIYNNRIQRFDWKSNVSVWTGINVSGAVNVGTDGANYIGNNTAIDNIRITYFAVGGPQVYGIKASTAAIIENNIIGSITTLMNTGITAAGVGFTGISTSGTGLVNNNTIGSRTVPMSVNITRESSGNAPQNVYGIYSSANYALITHNTIANINNGSTIASGATRGIYVSAVGTASCTIASNDIFSLSTSQPIPGIGASSSLDGVSIQSGGIASLIISGNVIYDLVNKSNAAVTVNGLIINLAQSLAGNMIERNNIQCFNTTSNAAIQNGINLLAGEASIQNNVIRMGIDKDGNSITSTAQINGILKNSGINNYYFNTVYIGGTGVTSGNVKTYAINILSKSTMIEEMQNNIVVNVRTNAVSKKLNHALFFPTLPPKSLKSDYNIYYTSDTDGKLSVVGGKDLLTLKELRANYEGADLHSGFGDPLFIHPNDAFATLDLRTGDNSPAEGSGINIPWIVDDIAGKQRDSNSPTDIGAYSGNFVPSDSGHDIFSPVITYETLGKGSSTISRSTVNFASITDNGGNINVTPGTKPRIYFKLQSNANVFSGNTSADNGWKWVESTGTTSPFDFTLDYSLLYGGPVKLNSVIQYFVVAQNKATIPAVTFNPYQGAAGASVTPEGMTPPGSPNSYSVASLLSAQIYVGAGQTYTTLTGIDGVFAALNAGSMITNTVVTIKSDLKEPGIIPLYQVSEDGPNAGKLTLKIQSDELPHIITGKAVVDLSPLISIAGAKRLTIDGGNGKSLIFRNTRSNPSNVGAVIQFDNSSQCDTLTNCIIESNSTQTRYGAIMFQNSGTNNVTISNNDIRNSRGDTIGSPIIGIYSNSTNNLLTILNNNLFNLNRNGSYGMYLHYLANGCKIAGNSIFMEKGITALGTFTGLHVGYSNNHLISGNYIGGSESKCGGSDPFIISGAGTFTGIDCNSTGIPEVIVQGNTIQNIKMINSSDPVFLGINNMDGPIIISENTIGHEALANSIQIAGAGISSGISHSTSESKSTCTFEKNIIANISFTNAIGTPTFSALKMNGGIIRKNKIYNIGSMVSTLKPSILGINSTNGNFTKEFSNNVISLNGGEAAEPSLCGFYENSISSNIGFYYNSIHIYGSASGVADSYAFRCASIQTCISENNILVNSRNGGSGKHYAIYLIPLTGFVNDYNDLYVTGTTLAHSGPASNGSDYPDIISWRKASGLENYSISEDPFFTTQTNLIPTNNSPVIGSGLPVNNLTTDAINVLRSVIAPTLGAYELDCQPPTSGGTIANDQTIWNSGIPALIINIVPASGNFGKLEYKWQRSVSPFTTWSDIPTSNSITYQPELLIQTTRFKRLAGTSCMRNWTDAVESNEVVITVTVNKWKGGSDNTWSNPENWTQHVVPLPGDNILFDDAPLRDCLLDQDCSVNNIEINQPVCLLNSNGHALTVKGLLNISNGAHVDCSVPNSTIIFSGDTVQKILSEAFVNHSVYALTIDNVAGTTLSSDLTVHHLLTLNPLSRLIVPPGILLNVEGIINNRAGVSGLVIQASPKGDAPNGSLIFHNDPVLDPVVPATVEMYTKASQIDGSYKWQFFGIPVKSIPANPTFSGSYVREMHENVTGTTGYWEQLHNESTLTSFTGYEITQKESKTIHFTGELENRDYGPVQLSYTPDATYKGQHLIGNPYATAINIKNEEIPANSITFGDGMDKTVYLYNTGSKADWFGGGLQGAGNSDAAGQYLSVPQDVAGSDLLPVSIPSMQAFLVMVNLPGKTATISIPYSSTGTVGKNTSLQRVLAHKPVSTRIEVNGSTYSDRMWLFTDSSCTHGFDNGWDGYKIMGSNLAPQIYAFEADANYQVSTLDNINNTYLGFKAGIDTIYTLTFTHQNCDTHYRNIYLLDVSENKTVEITATGSQYRFNSHSGFALEKRFKIIATPFDNVPAGYKTAKGDNPLTVFSSNHCIIVKNQSNLKGDLYLYDMTGRFIEKFNFNANDITTFAVNLPTGLYLSKAATLTDQITANLTLQE